MRDNDTVHKVELPKFADMEADIIDKIYVDRVNRL